ncbi:hypothetical protein EJ08DRAFT_642914 [Tothia fuscella]|uniref:C2H2-type domain-containing protein n=1 Tax=Tothia fuscella TaxID=1048955 RepID=A0A9P4NFM2_9PEZI|nr:hypothetical protein EJ08DRAFT_642914 [Tothia fuscella]
MDSPGSPLSELSSDDFQEEELSHHHQHQHAPIHHLSDHDEIEAKRPAKRQRTKATNRLSPHDTPSWSQAPPVPPEEDISSDTEGSVPGSPHIGPAGGEDDDYGGYGHREQISACKWDDCLAGDLGNMDLLVQHLHDEHIHARQKKYSCEWSDCSRKGIPHASGYALRAHMRSHTREKPFYCSLPECDRSFTRSDALAKHMRTVHETEALRPSDPVPKHHSSNPQNKQQRVRLTFKGLGGGPRESHQNGNGNGDIPAKPEAARSIRSNASAPSSPKASATIPPPTDLDYEHSNVVYAPTPLGSIHDSVKYFPSDIQFEEWEHQLPPDVLYKVLKQQLQHSSQDSALLSHELNLLEMRRKEEWTAKELVMENVMEAEFAVAKVEQYHDGLFEDRIVRGMSVELVDAVGLDLEGEKKPWWRKRNLLPYVKDLQVGQTVTPEMEKGGGSGREMPVIVD